MACEPNIYESFASVLTYPDADFDAKIQRCVRSSREVDANLGKQCEDWAAQMRKLSPEECEEVYARTFDMSPKCTLELGWHLFGESYDRGTFLVWMRGQLRDFSLSETTDLPDHVRHVLPVLGRMEEEAADKFSKACVLPALETIREGLEGMDSPYPVLIDAICTWLERRHGASSRDPASLPVLEDQHEELLSAEEV